MVAILASWWRVGQTAGRDNSIITQSYSIDLSRQWNVWPIQYKPEILLDVYLATYWSLIEFQIDRVLNQLIFYNG